MEPTTYVWDGVEHTTPDLEAGLHAALGDARYVGLGESVHTAGGYTVARATLFRHLVEHDGFRVLAMETPWLRADLARTYVETCRDPEGPALDALDATRVVFPVFADVALRDLFGWMCDWNRAHPDDPVQFTGFDVQQHPHARARLQVLLGDRAPGLAACPDWTGEPTPACFAALNATEAVLAQATGLWADEARQLLYGLRADLAPEGTTPDPRDRAMDATFRALAAARFPEERAVLWAHTGHLRRDGLAVRPSGSRRFDLGNYLAERYGDDYAAVAFVGSTVATNWPGMVAPVLEAPADSFESAVRDEVGNAPAALVVPTGAPYQRRWSVGGMRLVPADQFAAVVWMREVAALVPAFGGGVPMDLTPREADGAWVVHLPVTHREVRAGTLRRYATWELVGEAYDEGALDLTLSSKLDDREGTVSLRADGPDTLLRSRLPPPRPVTALAALGPPGSAVRLSGILAADRRSLALTDGGLVVPPALFPETWAGMVVDVVCTAGEGGVVACRQPELP